MTVNSAGFSVNPFGRSFRKRSVACNTVRTRFRFDSFVWQRCQLSHCELSTANESMICCLMYERHFPPNRKTALCHSDSRNMGGSPSGDAVGRAREDIPTHRPSRKENASPLIPDRRKRPKRLPVANGGVERKAWPCSAQGLIHHTATKRVHSEPDAVEISGSRTEWNLRDNQGQDSEDSGFPFALTFLGEGLTPCSP